jgi:polyhydroxyalkanoate synthesis regulator phasin
MGQKSAVDRLPEKLRARLREMLQDPAVTQAEIVDAINTEAGETLLSRSSMNRYAQRMKHFAEKNRQAKEIADAYIDKYGSDNRVKLGKVVNEQIRLAVFDLIGEIEEIREDPEIKSPQIADMLYKLSRGLKELEAAEKLNAERTESIRKAALAEAAEAVEQTAKSSGLTAETIEKIKKQILGL